MSFLQQYIKYIGGTWLIGVVEIIFTVLITEWFNIWFFYSYFIALICGMVVLFFYHNNVTFDIKTYNFKRMISFMFFMSLITLFNLAGVYLLVEKVHINYILAIMLVGIFTSLSGYTFNKKVLFKQIRVLQQSVKQVKRGVRKGVTGVTSSVQKGVSSSVETVKKITLPKMK